MATCKKHPILKFFLFLLIIGAIAFLFLYYFDWRGEIDKLKANHFKASPEITSLESQLNLTDRGSNLFYALSPQLDNAEKFNNDCSNISGVESGFLLGCYTSIAGQERLTVFNAGANATAAERELFDYDSSKRVTTAHEMLHGAYERRRWQDTVKIDQEIKAISTQISQSCQTNSPLSIEDCQIIASDMENYTSLNRSELYARLGTEVYLANLPENLAKDYLQYFNDTTDIVDSYRKNRQQELDIKARIQTLRTNLEESEKYVNLLTQKYYANPTYSGYYSTNNAINEYNKQVEEYNDLIRLYNSTFVEQLNSKSIQSLSK